jgi:molybdopterin-dependent oxidoreductase alpha subunit
MQPRVSFREYGGPAGGWGSARSLQDILAREGVPVSGALTMLRQNKPHGFQCVSCAWSKPGKPLPFEFCENGAKATAWEITSHRAGPDFFARHTVTELLGWRDHDLEQAGRLTQPMRYDAALDRYVPVAWDAAFADIGSRLRAVADRKRVVFYGSGRCSNEASYLYGLFARLYGNNNLPDSSNMCHETTSVALPASIGVPVGTVTLDDLAKTGCILFFGQNPGTNSPRMLHPLQHAARRGVPIITYNPLRERALERFTNPQSPLEMLTGEETRISSQYHQVRIAGDLAALTGICKSLVDMEETARRAGKPGVLDQAFIADHTVGFDSFAAFLRAHEWDAIEYESGLTRAAMEATARVYAAAPSALAIYGMGLTQHRNGVATIRMLVNLLLMRGNIGKPGAGICPVRGHSNVQGQRTVGITEKAGMVPLDRLAEQYGFAPPREDGLNTVEACEEILAGRIEAFVMLGGNFARAIPDTARMEEVWRDMALTVNVATKLNRSALLPGKTGYLLPVLGRIETDMQATGPQSVSIEDSLACIHGSRGVKSPPSRHLLSEVAVVAGMAKATLPANPNTPWDAWTGDYRLIRTAIGETYPDTFYDFERRMWEPGGFHRDLPARKRVWKTPSGKAEFVTPDGLVEDDDMPADGHDVLRLMTLRSNDQFNTTIYGYSDRFRGIEGTRDVLLMNADDIARLGLVEDGPVVVTTAGTDNHLRELHGLKVRPYPIPPGCVGAYYPEANVLLPLSHYAKGSKTPAAKNIPVRVRAI